ncbi:zinc finger MYM-type protein 1-like, partial [Aphis craccivora]
DENIDDPGSSSQSSSCELNSNIIAALTELDELPQSNLNIVSNSDLTDLGTLDTRPCRPILSAYIKTKFGKQYRSFQSEWFKNYEWLEYSIKCNAAFCFVCHMFNTSNVEDIWIKTGCNNWQKPKLSDAHHNQIVENRAYMAQIIEIVLYLGKQGVAFRGHSEKCDSINQGNFKELCNVFIKCVPNFKGHYDVKINYTSWKVQEEIIQISADYAREKIINEIKSAGFFDIMVDEARSHKQEQLSICIRYVVGFDIVERFLEFVDVSSGQDANHIVAAIFKCFEKLNINMNTLYIVAQSYDGASVMSGCLGGIARSVFNMLESVYVHFSRPSNNTELVKIQLQLGLKKGNILRVCDTRWVCRYKNCESMLTNYSAILNFLINEVDTQADKDVVEAIELAEKHNISLEVPQIGAEQDDQISASDSVELYWRRTVYFPIIDTIVNNLKFRFSEESLEMASSIDYFVEMDYEKNICKKATFPNVFKLLQVALTIPVSSATCERSFSSMRRLKNWLRASMEQQRFTNLSILNIERDIVNKISSSEILE